MGTICISIMTSGLQVKAHNLSFSGEYPIHPIWVMMSITCIKTNSHLKHFRHSSSNVIRYLSWRLDVGDGKEVNLDKCPRTKLQRQCIKYLGPVSLQLHLSLYFCQTNWIHKHYIQQRERESYEVVIHNGKLVYKESGIFVETFEGSKWIFVLSTMRTLYIGQKQKGLFQHSSFLAGGAITAAGRLVAHEGILEVKKKL